MFLQQASYTPSFGGLGLTGARPDGRERKPQKGQIYPFSVEEHHGSQTEVLGMRPAGDPRRYAVAPGARLRAPLKGDPKQAGQRDSRGNQRDNGTSGDKTRQEKKR